MIRIISAAAIIVALLAAYPASAQERKQCPHPESQVLMDCPKELPHRVATIDRAFIRKALWCDAGQAVLQGGTWRQLKDHKVKVIWKFKQVATTTKSGNVSFAVPLGVFSVSPEGKVSQTQSLSKDDEDEREDTVAALVAHCFHKNKQIRARQRAADWLKDMSSDVKGVINPEPDVARDPYGTIKKARTLEITNSRTTGINFKVLSIIELGLLLQLQQQSVHSALVAVTFVAPEVKKPPETKYIPDVDFSPEDALAECKRNGHTHARRSNRSQSTYTLICETPATLASVTAR